MLSQRTTTGLGLSVESRDLQDLSKGYVYFCEVCDEVLFLSRRPVLPRKILLVFGRCPGCGFSLEENLSRESSNLLTGVEVFTSSRKGVEDSPLRVRTDFQPEASRNGRSRFLPERGLTTGIEALDSAGLFRFGQLAVLQGPASNDLSLFLCVRTALPEPDGPDCDVVFFDGGNIFDPYAVARYAVQHGIDRAQALGRIHLSRAFTFHQLHSLATEKLACTVEKFHAGLAVVSDITMLYCDPDIRNKWEAHAIFARTVRALSETAERKNILVLATVQQPRDQILDSILQRSARASRKLEPGAVPSKPLKTSGRSSRKTIASYGERFDSKLAAYSDA